MKPPSMVPQAKPVVQTKPQNAAPAAPLKPATPKPAMRKQPFGYGSAVIHPKYGRGTAPRRECEGDDAKLTVSFPGFGLKKLVGKYAGIKEE